MELPVVSESHPQSPEPFYLPRTGGAPAHRIGGDQVRDTSRRYAPKEMDRALRELSEMRAVREPPRKAWYARLLLRAAAWIVRRYG